MSTYSLARGARGLVGTWETEGRIRYGVLDARSEPRTASGEATGCKHPSIASNERGEVLVAWIEGMSWGTGGTLAWKLFDAGGKELDAGRGEPGAVPAWSLVSALAFPDGRFTILY